jgi:hypothetical protein
MQNDILRELKEISAKRDGRLLATDVVAYAKNPKTALHSQFEWDDTEAARAFRIEQARRLIRITVTLIKTPTKEESVRAFVSLSSDRTQGGGYRDIEAVLSSKTMREQLLADAMAELEVFRLKYKHVKELVEVFRVIKRVKKRYTKANGTKGKAAAA